MSGMHEKVSCQLNTGVSVVQFYQERNSEVKEYHHVQQLICKKFLVEFVSFVVWQGIRYYGMGVACALLPLPSNSSNMSK
jgi:hypothetical protein